MERQLPKNVRQIGNVSDNPNINVGNLRLVINIGVTGWAILNVSELNIVKSIIGFDILS